MAALVREKPNITVREIANKMKFADNKSVYYWLDKGNYRGLGEFKQTILKEGTGNIEGHVVKQGSKDQCLIKIPLRDWNNKKTETGAKWHYMFHDYPNPRGLFAIKVSTNDFLPWFWENDVIVINTNLNIDSGSWILIKSGRSHQIVRSGGNKKIYHANSLQPYPQKGISILGPIIRVERTY